MPIPSARSLAERDSLNHLRVVTAIEEPYGVQLTTEEIVGLVSVDRVALLLQRDKGLEIY